MLYSLLSRGIECKTQTVSVDEAQDKLPDLLAQALAGNEVIITEHGTPVARLVPVVVHSKKKRVAGLHKIYRVIPDADAEMDGDIRVIDESGEDYLYPADWFVLIELPRSLERSLMRAA